MRLLITGPSRSGKSTAIHRLLAVLLPRAQEQWQVIILDGKGSELHPYASIPQVRYAGPTDLAHWAALLQEAADSLPARYQELAARGLRQAAEDDPRWLVVVDEAQRGTRDPVYGKAIKAALQLLAEQSGALGDIIVLSVQRAEHSIPPGIRVNFKTVRLLGEGFFVSDGVSGRVAYTTPQDALEATRLPPPDLDLNDLQALLGATAPQPGRIAATLYLARPGLGKTYALHHHPNHHPNHGWRRIYADAAQPHRQMLSDILRQCGAPVPSHHVPIPQLAEMACLALAAEPSLLLLDNCHQASAKSIPTIIRLIQAASEAALAADEPERPSDQRKLDRLIPYCRQVRLEPLPARQALDLALAHLPEGLPNRDTVARRIVAEAQGNPGHIIALAQRTRSGSIQELRSLHIPRKPISLGIILIVPLMALLIVTRWHLNADPATSYWLSLALLALAILLRPVFYRTIRKR